MKVLVIILAVGAGLPAFAADCSTITTYSGLIAAVSCTIGSGPTQLTFSNFTFTGFASGTGTTPTDMAVSVLNGAPATPPSTDALYGFIFNPSLLVSGIGVEDVHITYTVTAPSAIISSLHLLVNEIASGAGSTATVTENNLCTPPTTPCALFVGSTPPAAGFHQDLLGKGPYVTVAVDKDINVTSTTAGGFAAISGVRNAMDLVGGAIVPPPAPVACSTISNYSGLIAAGSCTIGSGPTQLTFSNFTFTGYATGTGTTPTDMGVSTINGAPATPPSTDTIYGFLFNPTLTVSGIGVEDIHISYTVTAPSAIISSLHLLVNEVAVGAGSTATVNEADTCNPPATPCTLFAGSTPPAAGFHEDLEGIGPYTTVFVDKDINVTSTTGGGFSAISGVRDAVDLTPPPPDCSTISRYSGLIAAGSCTIGSGPTKLTFSHFTLTGSASGTGTLPTDMAVSVLNGAPATPPSTDALYGFIFNPSLSVSGIGSEDARITYTVTAPSAIISSLHLLVNEIASGAGSTATVAENDTCSPPATPCVLSVGSPPSAGFHQDLVGIGPYVTVAVDKDINVTSTTASGFAAISGVRNAMDLVGGAIVPPPAPVACSTISNYSGLIAAGSCTIGSGPTQLTFSNFTFAPYATGTGTAPTDMGVSVLNGVPATAPSTDTIYGFLFNPSLSVSGIGVEDIRISYTVTAPLAIISSLHLLVNEVATGVGSTATVNETDTCNPPATPCTLFAGSTPPAAGFHQDLEGIGPYTTVFVDKDINVTSTTVGGFAAISGVRDAVDLTLAPDLTIAKAHVGSSFFQGQQNAQYTLTVTNGGTAISSGTITVSDTLPVGLSFVSGSGGGWACSAVAQAVTCQDAATPIASGGTSAITLNVNVATNAPATESNSATVACTCTELTTGNNVSNTDVVNVLQVPDLTIAKAHVGSSFFQGQQNAQYTLTVTNRGTAVSAGTITVSDTLPVGLSFVSGSGTGWTCTAIGQVVTCQDTATPIAPGGTSAITLNVNVAVNAPVTESNSATVACSCTELPTGNNLSNTDVVNVLPTGVPADGTFQVSYAANLNFGESWIDIINTGFNGVPILGPGVGNGNFANAGGTGNICVNVYTISSDEQLDGCCSCLVTPDEVVNLGVNRDLLGTKNTLTGASETSVTVKLIGSSITATNCANSAALVNASDIVSGFIAFRTTLHSTPVAGTYAATETPFLPAQFVTTGTAGANDELHSLVGRCAAILANGSGFGVCASCQQGALGAQKM